VFSQKLFPGLKDDDNNIVDDVLRKRHRRYHDMYGCQMPRDIVSIVRVVHPIEAFQMVKDLNQTFWNNLYEVKPDKEKKVIIKEKFDFVYGPDWRMGPIAIVLKEARMLFNPSEARMSPVALSPRI
jgi:hypothetical protein